MDNNISFWSKFWSVLTLLIVLGKCNPCEINRFLISYSQLTNHIKMSSPSEIGHFSCFSNLNSIGLCEVSGRILTANEFTLNKVKL